VKKKDGENGIVNPPILQNSCWFRRQECEHFPLLILPLLLFTVSSDLISPPQNKERTKEVLIILRTAVLSSSDAFSPQFETSLFSATTLVLLQLVVGLYSPPCV